MNNKVMVITGASSGIGKAVAIKAAKQGANLVLIARNVSALENLAHQLYHQYHTDSLVVKCDVSDKTQLEYAYQKIKSKYQRVDYLINCAGYGIFKLANEFSYEEVNEMFKVNTFGMIYLTTLISQLMVQQQSGHIFFVSSMAGKMATPNSSVYSSTKFAVIGYANALRLELKQANVFVTTVNPGPVATPFFSYDKNLRDYYEKVKRFTITPELVADKMVKVATQKPYTREINLPLSMSLAANLYQIFPYIGDYLALNIFNLK